MGIDKCVAACGWRVVLESGCAGAAKARWLAIYVDVELSFTWVFKIHKIREFCCIFARGACR